MLRVFADTDTDLLNTKPLAAALLAKLNRFPYVPASYDDYMVSQGMESQPPGKNIALLLT